MPASWAATFRGRFSDFDSKEKTVLVGEAAGNYKPWGHPANWRDPALGINRSPDGFGSLDKRGAQFMFADGHVEYIKNGMDPEILREITSPKRAK